MALVASFAGSLASDADTPIGWAAGTITGSIYYKTYIQGSACISYKASSKDGYGAYISPVGFDFTSEHLGHHVFFWLFMSLPGTLENLATGGLYLTVGSSSGDYKKFLIASKDYTGSLKKGFTRFVLDPTKTATEVVGSPDMSAITRLGVWIDTDTLVGEPQLFLDRIDVGLGLKVYGETGSFWDDLAAIDAGIDASNMYGVVQKVDEVFYVHGGLYIGDSSGTYNTDVFDSNKTVKFVSQKYYTGSQWVSMVADDFLKIKIVDSPEVHTRFTDGTLVGSDEGRGGSFIQGSLEAASLFDASTLTHAYSAIELHATKFFNLTAGIQMPLGIVGESSCFYDGEISNCEQVLPGSVVLRNLAFVDTESSSAALKWESGIDIQNCKFIYNASASIEMPSSTGSPFEYDGLAFSQGSPDVLNSSGAPITINKINGSDPESYSGSLVTFTSLALVNIALISNVSLQGAEIRIYDLDSAEQGNLGTELNGVESYEPQVLTEYPFTEQGGNLIWIQIMLSGYVEFGQEYTLPFSDEDVEINLTRELNA